MVLSEAASDATSTANTDYYTSRCKMTKAAPRKQQQTADGSVVATTERTGVMYYIPRVRICNKVPISDYFLWTNERGITFLCLPSSPRVTQELRAIGDACVKNLKQDQQMVDDSIALSMKEEISYLKITDNTLGILPSGKVNYGSAADAANIPLHRELLICIDVYGLNVDLVTGKAHLQMELSEWKIASLLGCHQ